jgi:hypothetical protein
MNRIKVEPPTQKGKKKSAVICGKRINFGYQGMSDYTKHHDVNRRLSYYARHYQKKNITLADISKIRQAEI